MAAAPQGFLYIPLQIAFLPVLSYLPRVRGTARSGPQPVSGAEARLPESHLSPSTRSPG